MLPPQLRGINDEKAAWAAANGKPASAQPTNITALSRRKSAAICPPPRLRLAMKRPTTKPNRTIQLIHRLPHCPIKNLKPPLRIGSRLFLQLINSAFYSTINSFAFFGNTDNTQGYGLYISPGFAQTGENPNKMAPTCPDARLKKRETSAPPLCVTQSAYSLV